MHHWSRPRDRSRHCGGVFPEGWRIAMADILRDDLSAAAETLQQAGAEVLALPVDLSDLSAAEQAMAAAAGHFGGIDCLVNNAAGHDFWESMR
ncbi:MAG: SDR family NAD(P)-dependent oxidoreductase [Verrucomicrobiales bacterium]